jgi:DNA-binding transcriptional ArsR family regulator
VPDSSVDARLRLQLEELASSMCTALNDPKHLTLLYALRGGPLTVSELSELLDTPQSNTSQHLAILRDRGLVVATRQGNSVYYSLRYPKVLQAVDLLREVMSDETERQQELHALAPSA